MTKQVFSYGGGRQTAAIVALLVQARLPRPDAIVMADTGREKSTTWAYLERYTGPALAELGMEVEIAPHELARTDIRAINGMIQIPMFTRPSGQLRTFCSVEWKRRVVQRWCRARWPGENVAAWIGFSADEINRVRVSNQLWYQHRYPLIEDVRLTSAECQALAVSMGWAAPPRSSCWMCPYQTNQEWRELPEADFRRAVELEAELFSDDGNVYLHRARRLLTDMDFSAQQDMFETEPGCRSGYCFT